MCQRKNFEKRSVIGEDMDKSKVPRFLWTTLYIFSAKVCRVFMDFCQTVANLRLLATFDVV